MKFRYTITSNSTIHVWVLCLIELEIYLGITIIAKDAYILLWERYTFNHFQYVMNQIIETRMSFGIIHNNHADVLFLTLMSIEFMTWQSHTPGERIHAFYHPR